MTHIVWLMCHDWNKDEYKIKFDPKNDEEKGINNDNELVSVIDQMYDNYPGKDGNVILKIKIKIKKQNYYKRKIGKILKF